jgi:hypothetical protein
MMPHGTTAKKCKGCGKTKDLELFAKELKNKDGRSGKCYDCTNEYYRTRNSIPSVKEQKQKYRDANKSRAKDYNKTYYQSNKDQILNNVKSWQTTNTGKVSSYKAKNKISRKKGYVDLTEEQAKAVADMYWLAKDLELVTGEKYHVDHIVPLCGKDVSGLHVPWNLQVLPADVNIRKSNKYDEKWPCDTF